MIAGDVDCCLIITLWTKTDLIKYINTLIVIIHCIKTYPEFVIALQRQGSSCEEKTFANTGKNMNNSIDVQLFINILVHTIIQKEVNQEMNIPTTKTWHNYIGGAPISNETPDSFAIPSDMIKNEILLLRPPTFSKNVNICKENLSHLNQLMINLAHDPNAKDRIPHNESFTSSKEILVRYGII